jgi:hypothetical protein
MFIQITTFDGPRGRDLVEASERAGRDRVAPLVEANPRLRQGLIGGLRALAPDGAECFVALAHDAESLDLLGQVVMTSELLPGEDPALLPGPDGSTRYEVAGLVGRLGQLLEAQREASR